MRRLLVLVLVLTGCAGETVTHTRAATPGPPAVPRRVLGGPYRGDTLPLHLLVPRRRFVDGAWHLGGDAVAVTFSGPRLPGDGPLTDAGFEIWRRTAPAAWTRVYLFRAGANAGLERLAVRAGDVTGDGRPDILLFEDLGGSGATGRWRLLALTRGLVRMLYLASGSRDNMLVTVERRSLVVYTGLDKDPKTKGYIHCCWLRWRREAFRWRAGVRTRSISFVRSPPASARID
jgi:hypothetical protein